MRLFCTEIIDDRALLSGQQHTHFVSALRGKVGDTVTVFCGDEYDYVCKIEQISRHSTVAQIVDRVYNDKELIVKTTLYMGLLRPVDKLELVVQKCVELGVYRIVPFLSKHTMSKLANIERLNKIALEATKQCGRSIIAQVANVVDFAQVVHSLDEYSLFAYENATLPIQTALDKLRSDIAANVNSRDRHIVQTPEQTIRRRMCYKNVSVVVGSEGGFCQEEICQVSKLVQPVSLGKRVLRAETAAITVMGILSLNLDSSL